MYSTSTSLQRLLEGYWRRCQISKDLLAIHVFQRSTLIRGFLSEKVVFRAVEQSIYLDIVLGGKCSKLCFTASLPISEPPTG